MLGTLQLRFLKAVCIWDVRKCQLLRALRGHKGVVFCVEMTDNTEKIYSGSRDNTIRVWHAESGLCLKCTKVSLMDPVMALHWNKGHLVGCYGRRITIWNTETWEKFATFITHENRVDTVQLSMEDHHAKPTGLLLTASQDEKVKYWDLKSRRYKTLSDDDLGKVNSAEFNDLYVVCGSSERGVKVWDFNPHSKLLKQRNKMNLTV